ncbi:MAG: hypothetical protein KDI90_00580 [Alphaproteobacteria bacterium]|nr:hypothetical protein [Alphaproteobacteria bacterium]MCB9974158.1 hypothetical protein [Rhodospirillales bacterium]
MRTQVYFRNVASIEEVKPDGSNLFPNVALAEGKNYTERMSAALDMIRSMGAIDSVVVLPDEGTEALSVPRDALKRLSQGRRIKIDTTPDRILQDPSWVEQDVRRYLDTRMRQLQLFPETPKSVFDQTFGDNPHANPYLEDSVSYGPITLKSYDLTIYDHLQADMNNLTRYYMSCVSDVARSADAHLVRSTLSYSPVYGASDAQNGYINCHIDDEPTFDARIVHVSFGSGTVLFDARDFEIQEGMRNGMQVFHPHLLHDGISCLTIAPGSSVVIREPSQKQLEQGMMPSIHSHGIGQPDGRPEERLVERHDLAFDL